VREVTASDYNLLRCETAAAPSQRVIKEIEALRITFVQNADDCPAIVALPGKGCGDENIDEPMHDGMRAIWRVSKRMIPANRMMQPGRRFEGDPPRSRMTQEFGNFTGHGDGVGRYASGSNFRERTIDPIERRY